MYSQLDVVDAPKLEQSFLTKVEMCVDFSSAEAPTFLEVIGDNNTKVISPVQEFMGTDSFDPEVFQNLLAMLVMNEHVCGLLYCIAAKEIIIQGEIVDTIKTSAELQKYMDGGGEVEQHTVLFASYENPEYSYLFKARILFDPETGIDENSTLDTWEGMCGKQSDFDEDNAPRLACLWARARCIRSRLET